MKLTVYLHIEMVLIILVLDFHLINRDLNFP